MDYYITEFEASASNAVALEDSIMKKDSTATAGSKMLGSFIAPFDAAVVERLCDAEIEISGKTHMREFGISGIFTDDKSGKSGQDGETAHGGDSGLSGPARVVFDDASSYCLCNDLFGQYRREAAQNGLCYIHPTYGTVSRYGLIPMASSMDQIGVMCKNLTEGFSLLSVIAGYDSRDGAMFPEKAYTYKSLEKDITICAPSHIIKQADEKTQKAIRDFSEKFTATDHTLEHFEVCKQVMYVLACAEISNNINRYDGIKFGYQSPSYKNLESLYTKTRTEAFGLETKLAAIMGSMVLSAEQYVPYYEKAMKIRRLIKEALRFDKYDVIVLPASIGGSAYKDLGLYAVSALAGLPSISFSYGGSGIQLIADIKNENALLTAWEVSHK